jgi:hypothetical protein
LSNSSAKFDFSAETGADLAYSLDGGPFQSLTSNDLLNKSFSLTGLKDGQHMVVLRATDKAGNVGLTSGYSWLVDTIDPFCAVNWPP